MRRWWHLVDRCKSPFSFQGTHLIQTALATGTSRQALLPAIPIVGTNVVLGWSKSLDRLVTAARVRSPILMTL
jgi:hypothetical protein